MNFLSAICKSTPLYLWHPLLVSLSLFAIVAVWLGWCLKEYSKQCNHRERRWFSNKALKTWPSSFAEGWLLTFFTALPIKAFVDADC